MIKRTIAAYMRNRRRVSARPIAHTGPFSVSPLPGFHEPDGANDIGPYLPVVWAWACFGLGLTFSAAINTIVWKLAELRNVSPIYIILGVSYLFLTALFGLKQSSYYYSDHTTGKDGIFKRRVGAFSELEMHLDYMLSITGGVLAAMAIPIFVGKITSWLITLFLYSLLIVARCFVVLLRPMIADKLLVDEPANIRKWYAQAHRKPHNIGDKRKPEGWDPPAILVGWIITHGMSALFAAILLILTWADLAPPPRYNATYYTAIFVGLVLLLYGMKLRSYEWGESVLRHCSWVRRSFLPPLSE